MTDFSSVPIAEVRRYWNERPCNIRHSAEPIGTARYFDQVEARKYKVEPHIPAFADFARWKDKRVLEIGCGIGTDTMNFARAGARVTAVDLSEESLAVARQRAKVFGLADRITFHTANAEELQATVPVEPFDLIYSFGVLHHTPNPERAFRSLRPYLGSAGELRVMLYYRYAWKVLWILGTYGRGRFWRLPELVARYSEAQTGCPVTFTYSKRGAEHLLAETGFRLKTAEIDHIFPYRIPDYKAYRYIKEWYFRWMPAPWFRALERRVGWHLLLTARPA